MEHVFYRFKIQTPHRLNNEARWLINRHEIYFTNLRHVPAVGSFLDVHPDVSLQVRRDRYLDDKVIIVEAALPGNLVIEDYEKVLLGEHPCRPKNGTRLSATQQETER